MSDNTHAFKPIFISHRSAHTKFECSQLTEQLKIYYGDVFGPLKTAQIVIVLIGEDWLWTKYSFHEILEKNYLWKLYDPNDRIRRDIKIALNQGKHIIPVYVQNTKPIKPRSLPKAIQQLADFASFQVDKSIDDLCIHLETIYPNLINKTPKYNPQRKLRQVKKELDELQITHADHKMLIKDVFKLSNNSTQLDEWWSKVYDSTSSIINQHFDKVEESTILFYFAYQANHNPEYGIEAFDKLVQHALTSQRIEYLELIARIILLLEKYPDNFSIFKTVAQNIVTQWVKIIENPMQPGSIEARLNIGNALGCLGDPRINKQNKWVTISMGRFWRGKANIDDHAGPDESPPGWVALSSYKISRWPITVREFLTFYSTGYHDQQYWCETGWIEHLNRKWVEPAYFAEQRMNWPVTGISWYEARAYCRWLTAIDHKLPSHYIYRLPTEAEWEMAARGNDKQLNPQRRYPWGDTWAEEHAFYGRWRRPAPVGLLPWGHSLDTQLWDMSGNVFEWCLDKVDAQHTHVKAYPQANQTMPYSKKGYGRVIRGGSYNSSSLCLRVSCRIWQMAVARKRVIGFRVVLSKKFAEYDE